MKENLISPLSNEYVKYQDIIKDIAVDEMITAEMYPMMVRDNQKKAMEKLTSDSSLEDIQKILEKTKYIKVSKRLMELRIRGFGDGIISLFERFDNQEDEEHPNPEILRDINLTALIPEEIRKNSRLSFDRSGYYYAGFFKSFD